MFGEGILFRYNGNLWGPFLLKWGICKELDYITGSIWSLYFSSLGLMFYLKILKLYVGTFVAHTVSVLYSKAVSKDFLVGDFIETFSKKL